MTKRVFLWDMYLDSLSLCGCEQRWREKEREREEVISLYLLLINHMLIMHLVCLFV